MRCSLLLALLAAPLLPISPVSLAQNASDWMDPPTSPSNFPLTDSPSLQSAPQQDRTDLTSRDGWFGSPARPTNPTTNLNPIPSKPVGPVPYPGQNKIRSLPVAQGISSNPRVGSSAHPNASANSMQAPRQHATNFSHLTNSPVANHPPHANALAPIGSNDPYQVSCGCASSNPSPFGNFGPVAGSSSLSNYMQCNPCNSACLWANYPIEHEKLWARKLRHINNSCGCFSDTQYFGNVLAAPCKNRYSHRCAAGSACQQGCETHVADPCIVPSSPCEDGSMINAAPIPQAEATSAHPLNPTYGPATQRNPTPSPASALPTSGRVATQPSPRRSPY